MRLDREIQQMADVADQLVTTLEKTVEELRRRAGVPPYDPANALTPGAPPVAAPAPPTGPPRAPPGGALQQDSHVPSAD